MTREDLKDYVAQHLTEKMTPLESGRYDLLYAVKAEDLLSVCRDLRNDENLQFDYFCNLGGHDTKQNFEAIYSIASVALKHRLDFKVTIPYDNAEIDSVQSIWPAANWFEREMWELYGINIRNHDNLTRFLLPDDWNQGFPMRKDWDAPDFIRFPEL